VQALLLLLLLDVLIIHNQAGECMSLAQRVEVLEKDMKELKQIARIKDESLRMIMAEQLEFREIVLARFRQVDKRMDGMQQENNKRFDKLELMMTTLLAQKT
jgi:biopolymer transport protein ExbB/TolQ